MALSGSYGQEENPFVPYDVPSQNLLKYNRFLINPTFSTVREDKSYLNLLHRNQSVQFDDNNQNYFLSYSGRISDRTGLGLSLYNQRQGTLSNFGILANYAYGVKLSDKSNFTFGANLSYYNSGFDQNRAVTVEEDPYLAGLQDSNLLSFQPGFNISYGPFDFGLFAENLIDYNLKTSTSVTEFKDKTFSGHLQYTHQFQNSAGMFEGGRLMPLARARQVGQNDIVLGGSLILDLPKIGWIQGGYDSFYGAAAGVGFNINRRISIGYTMEKGLSSNFDNFGLTHEISFAYSFTPNLTEDRVMLEEDNQDELAQSQLTPEEIRTPNEELEELKRKLAENDIIIEELMFRQDSLEANRQKDLERRFEMVMRMVRNETQGQRPDIERKAEALFLGNTERPALTENTSSGNTSNNIGDSGNDKSSFGDNSSSQADVASIDEADHQRNTVRDKITSPKNRPSVEDQEIKTRKFKNLEGADDGYYLVANVYKGDQYMNKFIDGLRDQGISADFVKNPDNGLKYVYLKRYDTWQEAKAAYHSHIGGSYDGNLWIMDVENRYRNDAYAAHVDKLNEKSARYGSDALQQNVVAKDNVGDAEPAPRTIKINGVGAGYYIIANVFANPRNANRFIKLLNSHGLSAGYFINPENNYRYVYLKRHESWNNALISYYSKLNDAYNDRMWIMRVNSGLTT